MERIRIVVVASSLVAGLALVPTATGSAAPTQPRTASAASTLAVITTIAVAGTPTGVAINNADDTVYVTHQFVSDTVSVIDGRTGTVANTISVGSAPTGVAVNQGDDTVYVTNLGANTVSVINGRTNTVDDTIPVGIEPVSVAVNQADDTVYVVNSGAFANTVSVIDGRNTDDSRTIAVGDAPREVAVNQADDTIYVANRVGNTVSVINGRSIDDSGTIGTETPMGVAVNQTDDTIYVTSIIGDTLLIINGLTGTVDDTVSVGEEPYGVAVDQADDTVYIANSSFSSNAVSIINGLTGTVDDTIRVGLAPRGVAVDDTGTNAGLVYVTNFSGSSVSVIARVSPSLASASGAAGSTVTVNVDIPQVAYDVDNSTITSVSFGSTVATGLTASTGDAWTLMVPAGSGTVPVTVTFNGGLTASAGSFTYSGSGPTSPAPTPASAPVDVTATAGNASSTITWAAPASSGDYPITTYRATASPGSRTCLVTAPARTCEVTGLTNGTAYTFTVQALTGAGWGTTSSPSNAVTPIAPPRPTITITGSRDGQRIKVTGIATGLAGTTLRPWIRFPGQTSHTEGMAAISPAADGTFTWSRKTGKKAYVYIAREATRSNTVTIPAR